MNVLVKNEAIVTEQAYVDLLKADLGTLYEGEEYSFLLNNLWKKEFHATLKIDENRAQDGLVLRLEAGFKKDEFGPARCLEVLYAISRRCEFVLSEGKMFHEIFWILLKNLGLLKYSNRAVEGMSTIFDIDRVLDIWMDRKYTRNGEGGLFPIPFMLWEGLGLKDLRGVELWYQMQFWCEYVIEKSPSYTFRKFGSSCDRGFRRALDDDH